jgi:hypothetical protein
MAEWMVVYSTHDLNDAHIVAGRLEVEGIKSFIQRESLANVFGITFGALGGTNVLVNPEDYTRALAILEPDELYALSDDNEDIIYYNNHPDNDDDDDE